jgi:N-acetylmuramoyl-L-alanine amidase CwlA
METKEMYLDQGHLNRPKNKLSKVTGVVVHWTANEARGADTEANRDYFNRKWRTIDGVPYELANLKGKPVKYRKASAHLIVDDTKLVECLPWKKGEAEEGYHVGAASYNSTTLKKLSTQSPNMCTIGLEICVNADGDFKKAYANAIQVTVMMIKEHDLGIDDLYRHYDVTGKHCPGFFVDDSYAKKYLGMTASAGWTKFISEVKAALSPSVTPVPKPTAYCKVYQNGKIYKYEFNTTDGAVGCAKDLFKQSGGKDNSIYATDAKGNTIYTPSKHPEDFPEFAPKPVPVIPKPTPALPTKTFYRLFMDGAQQGAFSDKDNAVQAADDLYIAKRNLSIHVKNPNGDIYYTPAKHMK